MNTEQIKTIVIVGGGTSGWMTASALATLLQGRYNIQLVESEDIGTVGVGEATIPMIQQFNQLLGIDEVDFIKQTQGTFKLGIEFVNWGKLGDRYIHGFGRIGQDRGIAGFDQYWRKMRASGKADRLGEYSISCVASKANKFMPPRFDIPNSPFADLAYAYHFDASLYAKYLRKFSEARGVQRIEGKIANIVQRQVDGHIQSVVLESGQQIDGEFFVDCSGFRGLLIEQTLKTGYEDWSKWLPCDRALAVPCASVKPLTPYTRSTAHSAGWQWRIPLQHRTGNGHVYCSSYTSDADAQTTLLTNLDGKALAEPRMLKFTAGMRKLGWNKNVVSIGLASGFLEPLESTSIFLVQAAIALLIKFFPNQGFNQVEIDEYNRQTRVEMEQIRDFIILHYKLNQRTDSPFWQYCANMDVPDSLRRKMELYSVSGKIFRENNELFSERSWIQVLEGQNLSSNAYHPLVDLHNEAEIIEHLNGIKNVIRDCVNAMPEHGEYIAKFCRAEPINK